MLENCQNLIVFVRNDKDRLFLGVIGKVTGYVCGVSAVDVGVKLLDDKAQEFFQALTRLLEFFVGFLKVLFGLGIRGLIYGSGKDFRELPPKRS